VERLLIFWATPKDVAVGWYIYLSIIILMSVPLVINLKLSKENKELLTQVLVLSTMVGFFVLVVTDVGLDWPDLISANKVEITPEIIQGEKIFFKYGCPNCHQIGNLGTEAGPNLAGVSLRKDREAMAIFFDDYFPGKLHAIMPNYKQIMKPEELELLMNFLDHL
jgi:cytochrome c551/c552